MAVTSAKIHFNDKGVPVAEDFDDVYFSAESGWEESLYVFLKNNQLPERWLEDADNKPSNNIPEPFVIAETGFGSGLNFIATWELYDRVRQQEENQGKTFPKLHFISVEKFPMSDGEIAKTSQPWPELQAYVDELVSQYPKLYPGCHRLSFDKGNITLDLWFGDIEDVLPNIQSPIEGIVDAWFLDGFAPDKNPQMWQPSLYEQVVRLGKAGSTFSTFTAAGQVRRDMKATGLDVEKRKGFGRKREMLAGYLNNKPTNKPPKPWFYRSSSTSDSKNIAIVGGGIAATSTALTLVRKGYSVTLYCQDKCLATRASGNRQAGFYPQLQADMNSQSLIYLHCFHYASRYYQALNNQGFEFAHDWCGVNILAFTPELQNRYQNLVSKNQWPQDTFEWLSPEQTAEKAAIDLPYWSLYFSEGGWLNPPELIQAQINAAKSVGELDIFYHYKLESYQQLANNEWKLVWNNGETTTADALVIATGADEQAMRLPNLVDLPLLAVRGQVEHLTTSENTASLKTVVCHKGYFTPALDNRHTLGSTYVKNDHCEEVRAEETKKNLQTQIKAMNDVNWPTSLQSDQQGRASIRCTTPDHLPIMGNLFNYQHQKGQFEDLYKALPDDRYPLAEPERNLFVLTGLGSRGLCTAPLLAEAIACQISGQPLPLNNKLLEHLSPNRFLIRDLIRRLN